MFSSVESYLYTMCGIAGIILPAASTQTETIRQMTAALAHRGPDGQNHWVSNDGAAHFGHCRLAIIDLSTAAAQPMHYLDRYTIIHNGEIYNYTELRQELIKFGYAFRTASDTEVILAAYDHWEEDCVDHFDGMFAFAIWDQQEKELFAARDRFGEKPFFYYHDKERFIFASEIKAIYAAGIPRVPNLKMLFNFITIGYVDNPTQPSETFFENIEKLPPASLLFYSAATGELITERYWDINPAKQQDKVDDNSAIEHWRELFQTSIRRRLRSDVTLGTSLSGGLDSSSIAAVMHQLDPGQPRKAFTAVFPGFDKDESDFSRTVARHTGMQQHTVHVTADDLVREWDQFLACQEEPVGSASAFVQYKVFQLAGSENVKVLLDGQGADETHAGYHKYYKWYWQELFGKRRLMSSRELSQAKAAGIKETFGFKNVIATLFPDLASVVLEQQYLAHALAQEDLSRDFVRLQSKEAYYTTPVVRDLNGVLYFNTITHGLEELLRYADRNSMAHGREVRLPFLSHELVEFMFSLPPHFKIRNGWTKWILRQSMESQLPAEITWRRDKTGFEPPQKSWMEHAGVQEMIHEARKKLVQERILKDTVLGKPVNSQEAYDRDNHDWRYLAAAHLL